MAINLSALVSFDVKGLSLLAQASSSFTQLGQAAQGAQQALHGSSMGGHAMMGVAEQMLRAIPKLTKDFGEFELAVATARATMGSSTDKQKDAIDQLVYAAKSMRDVEHAPTALAAAYSDFSRAGITGQKAMENLSVVSDVATVSQMDLKSAVEAVSTAQLAWANSQTSSRDIMQQFHAATTNSMWSLGPLIHAMGLAHGAAIAYRQSLNETLTSLSLLAPITGANTKAGSSFAAALRSVGDARKQLKLKALGVEVEDTMGGIRPILNIIGDFLEKTEKFSAAKRVSLITGIWGERGGREVAGVMRILEQGVVDLNGKFVTGKAAVVAYRKKIEHGNTTLGDAAKMMRESLPLAWDMFKANAQRALIGVGEKLAPFIRQLMDMGTALARAVEFISGTGLGKLLAFGAAAMAVAGAFSVVRRVLGGMSLLGGTGGAAGAVGGMVATPFWARAMNAVGGSAYSGYGSSVYPRQPGVFSRAGTAISDGFSGSRFGGLGMIPALGMAGGRAGAGMLGGLGVAGRVVGGGLGGLLGGLGGLATGVMGLLGPLGALGVAAWGVTEILNEMAEREAAREKRKQEYSGTIGNLPLIAQALRLVSEMKLSDADAKLGVALPQNIMSAFKSDPNSQLQFANAWKVMSDAQQDPALRAQLAAKGVNPAQYGMGQVVGALKNAIYNDPGLDDAGRGEKLKQLGLLAGDSRVITGASMGGGNAFIGRTAEGLDVNKIAVEQANANASNTSWWTMQAGARNASTDDYAAGFQLMWGALSQPMVDALGKIAERVVKVDSSRTKEEVTHHLIFEIGETELGRMTLDRTGQTAHLSPTKG